MRVIKRDKLVEYVRAHGLGDKAAAAKACGFPNVHALDVCLSEARKAGLLPHRGKAVAPKATKPEAPKAAKPNPAKAPCTSNAAPKKRHAVTHAPSVEAPAAPPVSVQRVVDGAELGELGAELGELGRLVVDVSNVVARLVHVASRLEGAPTLAEATSAFVSRLREAHITELPALLEAPVVVAAPSAVPRVAAKRRAAPQKTVPLALVPATAASPAPVSNEPYAVEDKAGKVLSRHATIEDATKAVRTARGGHLVRRSVDGAVMASKAPSRRRDEDDDGDDDGPEGDEAAE